MPKRKSWNEEKHSVKERRAYNVGYALGLAGDRSNSLEKMYNTKNGLVGNTFKEEMAAIRGFNRGCRRLEKGKKTR